MMSEGTVRLLLSLLDQVVLRGSEPNIEEAAVAIGVARRELERLLISQPETEE